MKKLLLMLLLSGMSMQEVEAVDQLQRGIKRSDDDSKSAEKRTAPRRRVTPEAVPVPDQRAAGAREGSSQELRPGTLLNKQMPRRFGAATLRSLTGKLTQGACEALLQRQRSESVKTLGELRLLDSMGTFSLNTVADLERAERVIDRLPMVFSLRLKKKSVQRFDASPLREEIAPYLEELDLRWCGLREVPAWVGGIAGLKKLNLSHNSHITIPAGFIFPAGLEELDLVRCGLREVPAALAGIAGLKKLNLYYNPDITIPNHCAFPAGLEELDLSYCCLLREVPAGIAALAGLKKLDLSGNWGIQIPDWLQAREDAGEIEIIL